MEQPDVKIKTMTDYPENGREIKYFWMPTGGGASILGGRGRSFNPDLRRMDFPVLFTDRISLESFMR